MSAVQFLNYTGKPLFVDGTPYPVNGSGCLKEASVRSPYPGAIYYLGFENVNLPEPRKNVILVLALEMALALKYHNPRRIDIACPLYAKERDGIVYAGGFALLR